jgi:hypothetical protein
MRSLRLLLIVLSLSGSLLAAESPFSGTWKLNPTKGHPTPPIPEWRNLIKRISNPCGWYTSGS